MAKGTDKISTTGGYATRLLVFAVLVWVLLPGFVHNFAHNLSPWGAWGIGLLKAMVEAALVGGLADWFAVEALFRHPLGLPIPHTAIIPTNQNRIAEKLAHFLETRFLTATEVGPWLAKKNIAGTVSAWFANPDGHVDNLRRQEVSGLVVRILDRLDGKGQIGRLIRGALRRKLAGFDLAPLLGHGLQAAMAEGHHRPVMEDGLRWVAKLLSDNEELIRKLAHDQASELVRFVRLDKILVTAILNGMYNLIKDCLNDPDHPLRQQMGDGLKTLSDRLIHDPVMQARVAHAKANILANPALGQWLVSLWEEARISLLGVAQGGRWPGFGLITSVGKAIHTNPELQTAINQFLCPLIADGVGRHSREIASLISTTINERWDPVKTSLQIEETVGNELQYIRINGTLLGGTIGAVLYAPMLGMLILFPVLYLRWRAYGWKNMWQCRKTTPPSP